MKKDALNWFEIFVSDFDRAQTFYEAILSTKLQLSEMEGTRMGIFPSDCDSGVGGAITLMKDYKPGRGGTLVYLNVEGELDAVLERIPAAGGKVIEGRVDISPHGFIGIFEDSEGNVVGLHSMK